MIYFANVKIMVKAFDLVPAQKDAYSNFDQFFEYIGKILCVKKCDDNNDILHELRNMAITSDVIILIALLWLYNWFNINSTLHRLARLDAYRDKLKSRWPGEFQEFYEKLQSKP